MSDPGFGTPANYWTDVEDGPYLDDDEDELDFWQDVNEEMEDGE